MRSFNKEARVGNSRENSIKQRNGQLSRRAKHKKKSDEIMNDEPSGKKGPWLRRKMSIEEAKKKTKIDRHLSRGGGESIVEGKCKQSRFGVESANHGE